MQISVFTFTDVVTHQIAHRKESAHHEASFPLRLLISSHRLFAIEI